MPYNSCFSEIAIIEFKWCKWLKYSLILQNTICTTANIVNFLLEIFISKRLFPISGVKSTRYVYAYVFWKIEMKDWNWYMLHRLHNTYIHMTFRAVIAFTDMTTGMEVTAIGQMTLFYEVELYFWPNTIPQGLPSRTSITKTNPSINAAWTSKWLPRPFPVLLCKL